MYPYECLNDVGSECWLMSHEFIHGHAEIGGGVPNWVCPFLLPHGWQVVWDDQHTEQVVEWLGSNELLHTASQQRSQDPRTPKHKDPTIRRQKTARTNNPQEKTPQDPGETCPPPLPPPPPPPPRTQDPRNKMRTQEEPRTQDPGPEASTQFCRTLFHLPLIGWCIGPCIMTTNLKFTVVLATCSSYPPPNHTPVRL